MNLKKLGLAAALLGTTALVGAWTWSDDVPPGVFDHVTNLFPAWGSTPLTVNADGTLSTRLMSYNGTGLSYQTISSGCTNSSTSPSLTLTPPAGQYIYFTSIDMNAQTATTAPTATASEFTSTGLRVGSNTTVNYLASIPATAGYYVPVYNESFNPPVRSGLAGGAVQFNGITAVTSIFQCIIVTYAFGP